MKRILTAAMVCATFLLAQVASAEGWRVGAAASFGDFEGDPNVPIDDSAVGFKLYGGYKFNNWFGVEGAYLNTSDFTQEATISSPKLDTSYSGFMVSAVGYVPLPGDEVEVYGKVGFFDFDQDLAISDANFQSGSEDGATAGVGAAIAIADNLGIRAEYEWFDIESGDFWSVNLGLEYRFGGPADE